MAKTRLIWVDVGMAVMAAVFFAIAILLRGEDYYIRVLFGTE